MLLLSSDLVNFIDLTVEDLLKRLGFWYLLSFRLIVSHLEKQLPV